MRIRGIWKSKKELTIHWAANFDEQLTLKSWLQELPSTRSEWTALKNFFKWSNALSNLGRKPLNEETR